MEKIFTPLTLGTKFILRQFFCMGANYGRGLTADEYPLK
jgi:hypothetical protein